MQNNLQHVKNSYQKIEYILIFLFFGWLLVNVFFGERIPANNGIGWDGRLYAEIAQRFTDLVSHNQLTQYSLQRVFPSATVYFAAKLMHIPITDLQIPLAFSIYNTTILFFAVLMWNAIAKKLMWNPHVRLISFAGLFLNYAILKMNTYYPTLTDTSAFMFGLLMMYFFLSNKNYCVLLTGIIGAFIFPTFLYVGLILFVFPVEKKQENITYIPTVSKKEKYFALFKAVNIVVASLVIYKISGEKSLGGYYGFPVLCISAIGLFIYLFLAMHPISKHSFNIFFMIKRALSYRILLALLVAVSVKKLIYFLSNKDAGVLTPWILITHIMAQALAYPLNFIISHIIYYGPIICFCIFFWKESVEYIKHKGPGLFIVTVLYVVLSIGSESRQFMNFFPIVVIVVAEVLNRKTLSWNFTYAFILLSLITSKVWLPLNHGEWFDLLTHPVELILAFPMQWYFMSQGPWVSHSMYIINLIAVSMLFLLTYKLSKNGIKNDS